MLPEAGEAGLRAGVREEKRFSKTRTQELNPWDLLTRWGGGGEATTERAVSEVNRKKQW